MAKVEFVLMTSTSDLYLHDAKELKSFYSLKALRDYLKQAFDAGEPVEEWWLDVLEDGQVKGWACIGVDYQGRVVLN